MANGFVSVDREQRFLLPPDMQEWLPADHEVWFVLEVIEQLDLSGFEAAYRLGGQGRRPFDPAMLLAVVVYGWSRGVRSSRALERACHQDVAFRVICGGRLLPDHTTIARFVQRHEGAISGLFVQVLELCGRFGMVSLGIVAVDGTKMAADASLDANRSEETLRTEVARIAAEHVRHDAEDDERFGDRRGDELPAELTDRATRRAKIAEALAARGARQHQDDAPTDGRAKVNVTDPASRIMKGRSGFVQGYNAQVVVADGEVIVAADVSTDPTDVAQLWPMLDAAAENLTVAGIEPAIEVVVADAGYYSEANVTTRGDSGPDLLIATTNRRKQPTTPPEVPAAIDVDLLVARDVWRRAEQQRRAIVFERIDRKELTIRPAAAELGLSKETTHRGYRTWLAHGKDIAAIPLIVPAVNGVPSTTRARLAMQAKLAEPANRTRYKRRSRLAETPFAEIKHRRGIRRFRRRGLTAVDSEWKLLAAIVNLGRLRSTIDKLFGWIAGGWIPQPAT